MFPLFAPFRLVALSVLFLSASYIQAGSVSIQTSGKEGRLLNHFLHYAFERNKSCRIVPKGGARVEAFSDDGRTMKGRLLGQDGKTIFERDYERGGAQLNCYQLVDDVILSLTGNPGISTSQIVFSSSDGQKGRIFICDFDGKHIRPLRIRFPSATAAAISPRGKQIAYLGQSSPSSGTLQIQDLTVGRSTSPSKEVFSSGRFAWSPDGKQLAGIVTLPGEPGGAKLTLFRPGKIQKGKAISKTAVTPSTLSWSPDGKEIVYASDVGQGRSTLFRIKTRTAGAKPKQVALPMPHASAPNWSPDGKHIAFVSSQRGSRHLVLYSPATGQIKKLVPGFDPHWGADSRHLVFTSGPELRLLDVPTGQVTVLVGGMGRIEEPSWTR